MDDGSGTDTRKALDRIVSDFEWVELRRHAVNQGKGAALVTGYRAAVERGFSHAIQLDADAQHESADVRRFLAVAGEPDVLVSASPSSMTAYRKSPVRPEALGRPGLACDPLARRARPAVRLPLRTSHARTAPDGPGVHGPADGLRARELAVRLVWMGVPVLNVATHVSYFPSGVSHFDVVWDDLRLAWLYTRLTVGMLVRAPQLLRRRAAGRRQA